MWREAGHRPKKMIPFEARKDSKISFSDDHYKVQVEKEYQQEWNLVPDVWYKIT